MIKAFYGSTTARVLVRKNLSQPFGIRSGIRQGCILSPLLFNYATDWILGRALHEGDGVEFAPRHRPTDLDYADDIALLVSSFVDLQSKVSQLRDSVATIPTVGFNVETVTYGKLRFNVWDVGGQEKIRPLWRHYYTGTQGLIFVVDSADRDRIEEAQMELHRIANDKEMQDAIILVFANKQDIPDVETEKPVSQRIDAPIFFGSSNSGRAFYVCDIATRRRFLGNTGAQIIVLSPTPADRRFPSPDLHLQAANSSSIPTFGSLSLTLNIGLLRSFTWIFVIVDVPRAILGSDLLAEFDLGKRRFVEMSEVAAA
nr:unnamed protein product [Spirometra erinaceieuropaei]